MNTVTGPGVTAIPSERDAGLQAALRRIEQAGYGDNVYQAYARAAPILTSQAGSAIAADLASSISHVAIRGGRRAAALLPSAALEAARQLPDAALVARWLEVVETVARQAPDILTLLFEHTGRLLSSLDIASFTAFVRMGLNIGRDDTARRHAFFSLQSAEALRLLDRRVGNGLADLRSCLKRYLGALWNIHPPLVETPADAPEHLRRRVGFGGGAIRVPASFPGFTSEDAKMLYRAALAHVGAHHRFTRAKFPAAGLKPLQIALVSLVEDARVERLAIGMMPGLRRLWARFHVARPEGPPVAISLMARLSRALLDPDYHDPHGWVEKGRMLFEEAVSTDGGDQQLSRRIGGLLGNDIGQMRLQFDAKTYVVQPAYRDDNLGIWDFGAEEQSPVELEAMVDGAVMRQEAGEDGRREESDDPGAAAGRLRPADEDDGVTVARYPEYDYATGQYRPEWCTVRELPARMGSAGAVAMLRDTRSDLVERLSALIRASRVSRQQRVRRQPEGEFLDMDASIAAMISRRAGEPPDTRVYGRYERRARDISVLLLIDVSRSTVDRVRGSSAGVLEVERLAASFLARAMDGLGDPFAVAAFCSNTREDVRYTRIKDFGQPFGDLALGRLAGLTGDLSTRLGPVIRHAGNDLARQKSYRRLLLIVTDGEPSDVDVDDRRYLVEDARAAVHELRREGVDVFCVALDSDAESYAERIFGRRGSLHINSIDSLPEKLPALYLRLRG